jgi:hypothetical protein
MSSVDAVAVLLRAPTHISNVLLEDLLVAVRYTISPVPVLAGICTAAGVIRLRQQEPAFGFLRSCLPALLLYAYMDLGIGLAAEFLSSNLALREAAWLVSLVPPLVLTVLLRISRSSREDDIATVPASMEQAAAHGDDDEL